VIVPLGRLASALDLHDESAGERGEQTMTSCGECLSQIDFYLDDELGNEELLRFQLHIDECESCRAALQDRRLLIEEIRRSGLLHVAPIELRRQIEDLLSNRAASARRTKFWAGRFSLGLVPAAATTVVFVAGIAMLWSVSERKANANAFIDTAVATRQRQLAGRLPSETKTGSPSEISKWFAGKLPFSFRLPASQQAPGERPLCYLTGASVVRFKGSETAYLGYSMNNQVIGLMVASERDATASDGETTVMGGVAFHSHQRNGLRVVTWSLRHLTYALVSSEDMPASQSCAVCHSARTDHELSRSLAVHHEPRGRREEVRY